MLLFALTASLAADPVSFEEARKDPSKRATYLAQLLDKLVYDEKANPAGLVKAWYAMTDEAHRGGACHCAKCGSAAMREEYKKDERESAYRSEIKKLLKAIESPALRVLPTYRDQTTFVGVGEHEGVLLVGDLFALAGEDEVRSVVEDFVVPFARAAVDGVKVKDRPIDMSPPAWDSMKYGTVTRLVGQTAQVAGILSGKRKVSEGFKREAVAEYLATYGEFGKAYVRQKKIWDDNNENTLQKEIIDGMELFRGWIHDQLKAAGVTHKLVSAEDQKYELEPAP